MTGECQSFGGGGWCDRGCGPCPDYAALTPAHPDWATCYSQCEALDEASCLEASGCYAAYWEDGWGADAPSLSGFKGCHATAPSGPVQGGGCYNLDAHACSRHDDCSLVYEGEYGPTDEQVGVGFARCVPEPSANGCAAVTCGPGYHCEEQCYPCDPMSGTCDEPNCQIACVPDDPGSSCDQVDCPPNSVCVETCDSPMMAGGGMVPGYCYPTCVPVGGGGGDPGSCTGEVLCDAIGPACPTGTVAGRMNGCWTGYCIPANQCGPSDPGNCSGAVICAAAPPACPANTTPGVSGGCWSGYCIPNHQCPAPTCETLTTEAACTARGDCTPVYDGDECTCVPWGCSCEELTYSHCETWGMVQPF